MKRTRLRALGLLATASVAAAAVPFLSSGPEAEAAPFSGGNLVVYRVGAAGGTLSNAAAPVFLDEFTPAGSSVQSIALPVAAGDGGQALTAAGLSRSEGLISRSADGRYVALTGYAAPVGALGPNGISLTASTVGRTVGLVDANGTVDTSTVLAGTAASTPKIIRSATFDGDRVLAAGGNGGLLSTTLGSPTVTSIAGGAAANLASVSSQGGQTFTSGLVTTRLSAVGADGALTALPGLPGNLLAYGYAFVDAVAGGYNGTSLDTLYLANASERAGTIDKYRWTGSTWASAGYVDAPGATGLVADKVNDVVSLAVTTPDQLLLVKDNAGSAASQFALTTAQRVAAPTGTEFRGVALAPTNTATTPSLFVRSPGTGTAYDVAGAGIPVSAYADATATAVSATVGSQTVALTHTGTSRLWTGTVPVANLPVGSTTATITQTAPGGPRTVQRTISIFRVPPPVVPPAVTPAPAPTAPAGAVTGTVSGSDAKIARKGSWKAGGSGITSKKKGSTATATVFGKTLVVTLARGPKAGKVTLVVDGRKTAVNLYAKKAGSVTRTFALGAVGSHSFQATVLGKKTKKSKGTTVGLTSLQVTS